MVRAPMRDRRFTLRASMAIVAACAILLTLIRSGILRPALFVVAHNAWGWALCLITTFAVARFFGPIVGGRGVGPQLRACSSLPYWPRSMRHGGSNGGRLGTVRFSAEDSLSPIR